MEKRRGVGEFVEGTIEIGKWVTAGLIRINVSDHTAAWLGKR